MKKILYVTLLVLLCSCSNSKLIYEKEDKNSEGHKVYLINTSRDKVISYTIQIESDEYRTSNREHISAEVSTTVFAEIMPGEREYLGATFSRYYNYSGSEFISIYDYKVVGEVIKNK